MKNLKKLLFTFITSVLVLVPVITNAETINVKTMEESLEESTKRRIERHFHGEVAETAEGARLLSGYTDKTVSRVRIPPSPPYLYLMKAPDDS